ncbi:hypothetical protein YH64_025905 [Achromobacter sp. LC458]|uniref:hypothetical protein n=1 Tax=Achromobacter sp. LC458 TaxID=1120623 RepID=UPI00069C71C0|nr:hypothetical protein [Achromobacter sp. LC458]TRM50108.1 hypothetical protein YH64_025905 [Achromobacter sp. LC458]
MVKKLDTGATGQQRLQPDLGLKALRLTSGFSIAQPPDLVAARQGQQALLIVQAPHVVVIDAGGIDAQAHIHNRKGAQDEVQADVFAFFNLNDEVA